MKPGDPQAGGPHFADRQWADFVRGVTGEAFRSEMQTHLDSGCTSCVASAAWMNTVAAMAASDRLLELPEDMVRRAREIFVAPRSEPGWIEKLETIAAHLVSEVRLDWPMAGVRSAGAEVERAGDRLLFRAGDYSVDIKVEPPSANETGEVIGQIANEQDRQESLDGVVVQMVVLGRTLGETATNRFGEFLIEYPTGKKAILRLTLKHQGKRIDLPLKPL